MVKMAKKLGELVSVETCSQGMYVRARTFLGLAASLKKSESGLARHLKERSSNNSAVRNGKSGAVPYLNFQELTPSSGVPAELCKICMSDVSFF
jgi:hypothetical protein